MNKNIVKIDIFLIICLVGFNVAKQFYHLLPYNLTEHFVFKAKKLRRISTLFLVDSSMGQTLE